MEENSKKRRKIQNNAQTFVQRLVPVEEYSAARLQEMKEFQRYLKEFRSQRRTYQTLPPNRRRRVMSRNVHYLPPHLRSYALREKTKMESNCKARPSTTAATAAQKSRRSRRVAPRKLLIENLQRSLKNRWLETHLWYCKRAVMKNLWGYRLPVVMNDRSIRSSCKASFHGCTIYDVSYMECLELVGIAEHIYSILRTLTDAAACATVETVLQAVL
uniref:Ribonucleases P/MRP protein subunit POP1 n=1 Tax=Lygus hesperus TaxID=30085 RepID=A0A0A9W312_LYGHE